MGIQHGTDILLEQFHHPIGWWTDRIPYGKVVSKQCALRHMSLLIGKEATYKDIRYKVVDAYLEGQEAGFGKIIAVVQKVQE